MTSIHVSSLFPSCGTGWEHCSREHGTGEDGGVAVMSRLVSRHPSLGRSHGNSSKLLVILSHGCLLLHAPERLLCYLLLGGQLGVAGWLLGGSGGLARGFAAVGGLARGGLSWGGLVGWLWGGRLVGERGVG